MGPRVAVNTDPAVPDPLGVLVGGTASTDLEISPTRRKRKPTPNTLLSTVAVRVVDVRPDTTPSYSPRLVPPKAAGLVAVLHKASLKRASGLGRAATFTSRQFPSDRRLACLLLPLRPLLAAPSNAEQKCFRRSRRRANSPP